MDELELKQANLERQMLLIFSYMQNIDLNSYIPIHVEAGHCGTLLLSQLLGG